MNTLKITQKERRGRRRLCSRPVAYALSFMMALSPLLTVRASHGMNGSVVQPSSTVADTPVVTETTNHVVEYDGEFYRVGTLAVEGYTKFYNGRFDEALSIIKALYDNGYSEKGERMLHSFYEHLDLMDKDELLRFAEECEKRGLYGEAGYSYKRLGMMDKAEECFKKDTEKILKEIEKIEKQREDYRED